MFEFDSGIVCCELPVHPFLHSIPISVPFLEFRVQVQCFAWADAMLCVGKSFAWADAKLCVGRCNALRGRMQCFAWADAMLCVRFRLNWHINVCPILDKRKKGEKTHPTGHLAPRKFLLNQNQRFVPLVHIIPQQGVA